MEQSRPNTGGGSPRYFSGTSRAEEGASPQSGRMRLAHEEREIERAKNRHKAFFDKMQEGDEGQGEWESSARGL